MRYSVEDFFFLKGFTNKKEGLSIFLFKKQVYSKKIIGIASVEHGLGTTHIALTLANYLCSKLGMKTAYVELNTHNHICALARNNKRSFFLYKGIVFYPNTNVTSLAEILRKDYRYFILDMGVITTYTANEFLRCDKSFLICSASKWRKSQQKKRTENLFKHQSKKNCITLIMNLKSEESYPGFSFPYISNPFQIEPKHFRAISLLLKNL